MAPKSQAGFISYAQFREALGKASPQPYQQRLLASVLAMRLAPDAKSIAPALPQMFDHTRNLIEQTYQGVDESDVAASFVDEGGVYVDCIKVDKQPGAAEHQAGGESPEPPPFKEMEEGSAPPRNPVPSQLGEGKKDRFGNPMFCPEGYVPVVRLTLNRIADAGGATNFLQKSPDGGRHPTLGNGRPTSPPPRVRPATGGGQAPPPFQVFQGYLHAYAHASQRVSNWGGQSWLNVWNPNPDPGVFSLSQQWFAWGSGGSLQTVEGGWHVFPSHYNNSYQTRLFVYSTANGYASGGYNLEGGLFQQTDNSWVLGGTISPVSSAGGQQAGFLMQWQRDDSGNWWLYLQSSGDPVAVGYYPAGHFGGVRDADSVDFGGEVCSQMNARQTGAMGSGQDASTGWQQAAFHKLISYYPTDASGLQEATLTPDQQDAPTYTLDPHNNSGTSGGTYFYFGGAGGSF
jgi:hypothetical protein